MINYQNDVASGNLPQWSIEGAGNRFGQKNWWSTNQAKWLNQQKLINQRIESNGEAVGGKWKGS